MKTAPTCPSFLVIGENIHATRTLARTGRHITTIDDGRPAIGFADAAGVARTMPIAQPIAAGSDFAAGKVKHVRNAVLLGMAAAGLADRELAGPASAAAAEVAEAYLVHLAVRQARAGADWLDVNVDEVAGDLSVRVAAMDWIVRLLEAAPEVTVPVALDSSSSEVLQAGLAASASPHGRPLLNSASLERPDVLGLAAAHGCPLVISAAGERSLPATADGRFANTDRILAEAERYGIPLADCHLDPLVMPAGVDPEAGAAFLEAARRIRAAYGPELHITGGLSNVSFGLPGRRLVNDVFLVLAMEAGVDSGIVDPVVADFDRILGLDRASPASRLTEDLLLGRDAFGMEFLAAYRAGVLADALA
ncbi:MAG: dihydropteroate synthase [Chloroflexota bacterium]